MVLEVHEAEALRLALCVAHQLVARDLAVLVEHGAELLIRHLVVDVLHEHVREDLVGVHRLPVLLGDELSDEDNLAVEEHAVDLGDSLLGSLAGLVVNETVALRLTGLVGDNLAGEDVAEGGERVVKRHVVDGLVEVLDEHVAEARFADARVAARPHDPAGAVLDLAIVQGIQGPLGVRDVVVVHVGVSERAAGDRVAADANRGHRPHLLEHVEEEALAYVRVQVSNVERGRHGAWLARGKAGRARRCSRRSGSRGGSSCCRGGSRGSRGSGSSLLSRGGLRCGSSCRSHPVVCFFFVRFLFFLVFLSRVNQ
mmetsp:Transcript_20923/g.80570  ORF Transcript_20923/g.80570 Transcript_20923/m.80570 type:complete len:312 (+) Transcript_20923:1462-2397(+)